MDSVKHFSCYDGCRIICYFCGHKIKDREVYCYGYNKEFADRIFYLENFERSNDGFFILCEFHKLLFV